MASSDWNERASGRKRRGAFASAFKSVCLGLGLGLTLGYAMLSLNVMAPVRYYACAHLPGLGDTLSCYD
jgi:hypothetical protein